MYDFEIAIEENSKVAESFIKDFIKNNPIRTGGAMRSSTPVYMGIKDEGDVYAGVKFEAPAANGTWQKSAINFLNKFIEECPLGTSVYFENGNIIIIYVHIHSCDPD